MSIGSSDRSVCKAVGEDTMSSQLTKIEVALVGRSEVLSAQSAMLTAQSEAMFKQISRLETLE